MKQAIKNRLKRVTFKQEKYSFELCLGVQKNRSNPPEEIVKSISVYNGNGDISFFLNPEDYAEFAKQRYIHDQEVKAVRKANQKRIGIAKKDHGIHWTRFVKLKDETQVAYSHGGIRAVNTIENRETQWKSKIQSFLNDWIKNYGVHPQEPIKMAIWSVSGIQPILKIQCH